MKFLIAVSFLLIMTTNSCDKKECPLCMDPLELDDLNFFPCACLYQICRFCWFRLINEDKGLCPACRMPYNSEKPASFKPLSEEELASRRKEQKKQVMQKKQKTAESRKHLADVRVIQKNLVFVMNLPQRLSDTDLLKGSESFGKYGKVYKVIINRNNPTNQANTNQSNQAPVTGAQPPPQQPQQQQQQSQPHLQTVSAYVTYQRCEDALRAIIELNKLHVDNRCLRASLGTTKYCSQFLKGLPCVKHECMYLHEQGEEAASFTKEEMSQGKHADYERKLIDQFFPGTVVTNHHHHSNHNHQYPHHHHQHNGFLSAGGNESSPPAGGAASNSLPYVNYPAQSRVRLRPGLPPPISARLSHTGPAPPPPDQITRTSLDTTVGSPLALTGCQAEDAPCLDFDPVIEAQQGLALAMATERTWEREQGPTTLMYPTTVTCAPPNATRCSCSCGSPDSTVYYRRAAVHPQILVPLSLPPQTAAICIHTQHPPAAQSIVQQPPRVLVAPVILANGQYLAAAAMTHEHHLSHPQHQSQLPHPVYITLPPGLQHEPQPPHLLTNGVTAPLPPSTSAGFNGSDVFNLSCMSDAMFLTDLSKPLMPPLITLTNGSGHPKETMGAAGSSVVLSIPPTPNSVLTLTPTVCQEAQRQQRTSHPCPQPSPLATNSTIPNSNSHSSDTGSLDQHIASWAVDAYTSYSRGGGAAAGGRTETIPAIHLAFSTTPDATAASSNASPSAPPPLPLPASAGIWYSAVQTDAQQPTAYWPIGREGELILPDSTGYYYPKRGNLQQQPRTPGATTNHSGNCSFADWQTSRPIPTRMDGSITTTTLWTSPAGRTGPDPVSFIPGPASLF